MNKPHSQENNFASLVTKLSKPDELSVQKFTPFLMELVIVGAKAPGFWSSEIKSPQSESAAQWCIVQRFRSLTDCESWQASATRKSILSDFEKGAAPGRPLAVSDEIVTDDTTNEVATAIVTHLRPGMEEDYFAWERKLQSTQASFPGYLGSYIQPPVEGRPGQWATLLRFKSPESLEKWFASPERALLLEEGEQFVKGYQFQKMDSAFPGWFPIDVQGNSPPNWKTAQLVLLGIFPIVMLQIKFCNPIFRDAGMDAISPTLGVVLNMIVSCTLVAWVTMPSFIKLFQFWLYPETPSPKVNLRGELAVLAVLAVEMFLLWHLF